jgi:hypothetical protein
LSSGTRISSSRVNLQNGKPDIDQFVKSVDKSAKNHRAIATGAEERKWCREEGTSGVDKQRIGV